MSWQDPYGQYGQNQNPYGQTQPGYGWQDPYGGTPGYGPPGPPPGGSNGAAVGALVANIIAAVLCCAGIAWLPGVILSSMAMSRNATDPESSRQLTMWAWVCFVLNIVLVVAFFVVMFAVGAFHDSSTGTSTDY